MNFLSRVGSFSLLRKHADKVAQKVTRNRRKQRKKKNFKLNITDKELETLANQIISGQFRFSSFTPQEIRKANNKGYRGLMIPKRNDRIVHRAMLEVVLPYYINYIKKGNSYGVNKGRGIQKAFVDLKGLLKQQEYTHVLVADVQKFFNTIDKNSLEKKVLSFLKKDHSLENLI